MEISADLWYNCLMNNDDRKLGPTDDLSLTDEVRDPEVERPAVATAKAASDVLDGKTLVESQKEDPMAKTLAQFLKELEQEKTPNAMDKVRKIQRVLMFVGRYVDVKTDKMLLKKQAGLGVGEAFEDHAEFDPILFDNKTLTEDHLTIIRHALLHELFHMEKDIPNEGLAEIASSRLSLDKVRDYEDLVQNVLQVTNAIGEGDKDRGILETVQLYSEKKYDELFTKFHGAYDRTHPQAVAKNPDVAEKVFRLAFPELVFETNENGEAKWIEDEEAVEEESAPSEETPAE